MYKINGGISNIQHTHNIIIELAYSFGIPTAIIFLIFIVFFLYKKVFQIYLNLERNMILIKFGLFQHLLLF